MMGAASDEKAAGHVGSAKVLNGAVDQTSKRLARIGMGKGNVGGAEACLCMTGEDLLIQTRFRAERRIKAS